MDFRSIFHRHSIRLKDYDYSSAGAYFVTICTHDRECLFGDIIDGEMVLNDAGMMIDRIYNEMPRYFDNIVIDEYCIMPNHFHGIIHIVGAESISAQNAESISAQNAESISVPDIKNNITQNRVDIESTPTNESNAGKGLPNIIQTFKRYTTIEYIKMVKNNVAPPFNKTFWQRNYYEHIIRDESDLCRIRDYIVNNPARWQDDEENPRYC